MKVIFPTDKNLQPSPAPADVHANISNNADSAPIPNRSVPVASVSPDAVVARQVIVETPDGSGLLGWGIAFGIVFGIVFGIAAIYLYFWARRSR